MMADGTANDKPQSTSTKAEAKRVPKMFPTEWLARQIPMINPMDWIKSDISFCKLPHRKLQNIPRFPFPSQLPTAVTQLGHPVDCDTPATILNQSKKSAIKWLW